MKRLTTNESMNINAGKTVTIRCKICNQKVVANYWGQYKHCLRHASRCLPWGEIMAIAFGIWL